MYENYEEIITDETGGAGTNLPGISLYDDRPGIATVSSGDAGSVAAVYNESGYELSTIVLPDALGGSVSGSDYYSDFSLVQENLAQINESVQSLYSLVSLILAFLLLDWTGRKIIATVKRFSGRYK